MCVWLFQEPKLEVPTIKKGLYKGYVREYPQKYPHMKKEGTRRPIPII